MAKEDAGFEFRLKNRWNKKCLSEEIKTILFN